MCFYIFFSPYFDNWETEAEWRGKTDSKTAMWISRFWAQKQTVDLQLTCFSPQAPGFPGHLSQGQDEHLLANCNMAKQETGKGSWWAGQRSGDELTLKGNIPQLKRLFINFGNRKRNALTIPELNHCWKQCVQNMCQAIPSDIMCGLSFTVLLL